MVIIITVIIKIIVINDNNDNRVIIIIVLSWIYQRCILLGMVADFGSTFFQSGLFWVFIHQNLTKRFFSARFVVLCHKICCHLLWNHHKNMFWIKSEFCNLFHTSGRRQTNRLAFERFLWGANSDSKILIRSEFFDAKARN